MKKQNFAFSVANTSFYFDANVSILSAIVDKKYAIIITDSNVFAAHSKKLKGYKTIVIPAGEVYKTQATVDNIIAQLIDAKADRKTTLVGIGGGVVTDITGYVGSIYMRGIAFGFVPTTLLALVDASIGGKNGIDVGLYKNIIGITKQPQFIIQDLALLNTLPETEWQNGFAEIIKHACIKNAAMFKDLQNNNLKFYRNNKTETAKLVQKNATIKIKVVQQDEFEQGERKLLNFGHTLGHAIENKYQLSHGHAVSIGMANACKISKQLLGFKQTDTVVKTLEQYGLPTYFAFDKKAVIDDVTMDKKRERSSINYILLEKIGKGIVKPIELTELEHILLHL